MPDEKAEAQKGAGISLISPSWEATGVGTVCCESASPMASLLSKAEEAFAEVIISFQSLCCVEDHSGID